MINNVAGKRRVGYCVIFVSLLCCITLCAAGIVCAQDLEINDPDLEWVHDAGPGSLANYDYGNVIVGQSKTATFDLYSAGPSAVWVYVITLNELRSDSSGSIVNPGDWLDPHYTLGAFSFNPANPFRDPSGTRFALPMETPTDTTIVTDMIFSPPSVGDYSAYLYIFSNDSIDPPGMYTFIHLQGPASRPPFPNLLQCSFSFSALPGWLESNEDQTSRSLSDDGSKQGRGPCFFFNPNAASDGCAWQTYRRMCLCCPSISPYREVQDFPLTRR